MKICKKIGIKVEQEGGLRRGGILGLLAGKSCCRSNDNLVSQIRSVDGVNSIREYEQFYSV